MTILFADLTICRAQAVRYIILLRSLDYLRIYYLDTLLAPRAHTHGVFHQAY